MVVVIKSMGGYGDGAVKQRNESVKKTKNASTTV
jgi:hypothetical protein